MEEPAGDSRALSAAGRARAERQRARARELRAARTTLTALNKQHAHVQHQSVDSGGGFLLEAEGPAAPAAPLPPPDAPPAARCEWPACEGGCGARVPTSFLLDTFGLAVCDACRDEEGAHRLVPRGEARSLYLLQECDLDARPPPLRCLRRPNPHAARSAPMRLYLAAQLEQRALQVWGSAEALERAREQRAARRERLQAARYGRELRALRRGVRAGAGARAPAAHEHAWGAEEHEAVSDTYSRRCDLCGATQTYEKM